ncbi:hypothetical protein HKX48_001754 [Thoreauomyces humboldtii]|nr:hypothetical protein HKX48_001754 [Thoreauomyces humboldtii]
MQPAAGSSFNDSDISTTTIITSAAGTSFPANTDAVHTTTSHHLLAEEKERRLRYRLELSSQQRRQYLSQMREREREAEQEQQARSDVAETASGQSPIVHHIHQHHQHQHHPYQPQRQPSLASSHQPSASASTVPSHPRLNLGFPQDLKQVDSLARRPKPLTHASESSTDPSLGVPEQQQVPGQIHSAYPASSGPASPQQEMPQEQEQEQEQELEPDQDKDMHLSARSEDSTAMDGLAELCHQQSLRNLQLRHQQQREQQLMDHRHEREQQAFLQSQRRSNPSHTRTPSPKPASSSCTSSPDESDEEMACETLVPIVAHYELAVRQQPERARMSGYHNKDRRPMDPTPIVQLLARDPDGEPVDISYPEAPFMVLHASLWSTDMTTEYTNGVTPSPANHADSLPSASMDMSSFTASNGPLSADAPSPSDLPPPVPTDPERRMSLGSAASMPILLGGLVSSCHILRNEEGEKGLYFVFPDVGVRTSGLYRLKFNLFVVEASDMGFRSGAESAAAAAATAAAEAAAAAATAGTTAGDTEDMMIPSIRRPRSSHPPASFPPSSHTPRASTFSEVFKVYSPKAFPGMAGKV